MWRLSSSVNSSSSSASATLTASCRSSSTATTTTTGWLRSAVSRTRAYLLASFDSFKRRHRDDGRRRVTNAQLRRLNRKIVSQFVSNTRIFSFSQIKGLLHWRRQIWAKLTGSVVRASARVVWQERARGFFC